MIKTLFKYLFEKDTVPDPELPRMDLDYDLIAKEIAIRVNRENKAKVKPHTVKRKPKHTHLRKSEAAEIKWLVEHSDLKQKEIASIYQVGQPTISNVKSGVSHPEVKAKKPKGHHYES
jgi:DNA-binding transcriptional regulator YiaG